MDSNYYIISGVSFDKEKILRSPKLHHLKKVKEETKVISQLTAVGPTNKTAHNPECAGIPD